MNKYLVLSATALLLSACGGGGGGSTASDVSVGFSSINVADGSAPKRIEFSWAVDDASNVDEFVLLENADGSSGFTEVARVDGSETSLEYELSVHLTDWINAEYIVEARTALNAKIGSSDEVNLTQALSAKATGYFKASDPGEYDGFGNAVAVSGDGSTLAVGAASEDSEIAEGDSIDAYDAGAVYIFKNQSGIWESTLKITPDTRVQTEYFGRSVALSDDGLTLVVGADALGDSGTVYVFTLAESGSTASNQIDIKPNNPSPDDYFGASVSLTQDGNSLAVGALREDSVNNDSGAVYIFERDNMGTWTQDAMIKASNAGEEDWFGASVALVQGATKKILAVGAPQEESNGTGVNTVGAKANNSASDAGAVYVYEDIGSGWPSQENYYIKASNTAQNDEFGWDLALSNSGITLVVGAGNQGGSEGAVYVFHRSDFGYAQSAYLKAVNADAEDNFGFDLSLSGDGSVLAVGAGYENGSATGINGDDTKNDLNHAGAAYVFERSNSGWTPKSYVKASYAGDDDELGLALSLSEDGSVLAIGARSEDGGATGVDRDHDDTVPYSGAIYLY